MTNTSLRQTLAEFLAYRRQFLPQLTPGVRLLIGAVVLVVGVTVTNTLMIWAMGKPFDLLAQRKFDVLAQTLAWIAVLIVVNQSLHFFYTLTANRLGLELVGRVRNGLLARITSLSTPVASRYGTGDLLARLSNDIDRIQSLLIEQPLFLFSHALTFVFYSGMLLYIDWRLALLALCLAPLFLVLQRILSVRKRRAAEGFLVHNAKLLATEEESVTRLQGIASLNAESAVVAKHKNAFAVALHWALKERWLDVTFTASVSLLVYGSALIVVYFGVRGIETESLTLGALTSFLLYLGYLSVPVRGFVHVPFQMQADFAAAARVVEIWTMPSNVVEKPDAEALLVTKGDICFQHVAFAYSGSERLLNNFDVTIEGGKTIALVGQSGSGKSTLIKLLLRFYDVQVGAITIDGVDVRDVTLESLRRAMAVVWQQPVLFRDTVRANMLLANPHASDEEIWSALKNAHAADFVRELRGGLDTVIGAGETELSAGQQQRLSIAQAYLRNAPILIMDEASSALDSQTEEKIVTALETLRHGRTTLLIAHRYSSIRNADYIVYLNRDGTCAVGTHAELLRSHAGYQEAVNWQTGGG